MYSSTSIFLKAQYDEEFHRLDEEIAGAARTTPASLARGPRRPRRLGSKERGPATGRRRTTSRGRITAGYLSEKITNKEPYAADLPGTIRRRAIGKPGELALPDREVGNRLHQLRQDVRFALRELGDAAAVTEVEGVRHADQEEWTLSVTTSLSLEEAAKAAEFGLGKVQMLLVA